MIPINIGVEGFTALHNGSTSLAQLKRNTDASMRLHKIHGGGGHCMPCCLEPWEIVPMIEMAATAPEGCFVEVGVYWGGTAHHLSALAKTQGRPVYLYDTFEGMPYKDAEDANHGVPVGELKTGMARVRGFLGKYPTIVKGIFPCEPMPPAPIAFAHVDVDAYRSTLETCIALEGLMAKGGIMWFDDTAGGPFGGLDGARQAIRELRYECSVDPITNRWFTVFE
jgi:hypothetical protein